MILGLEGTAGKLGWGMEAPAGRPRGWTAAIPAFREGADTRAGRPGAIGLGELDGSGRESGWCWWGEPAETAQRDEQTRPSRLAVQELQVGLSGVAGELGRQTEEPEAEALGLGRSPGAGKRRGAGSGVKDLLDPYPPSRQTDTCISLFASGSGIVALYTMPVISCVDDLLPLHISNVGWVRPEHGGCW